MKSSCLLFLIPLAFAYCTSDRTDNEPEDPVIIASESGYSKDFVSKRAYGGDLVEKLYDEKSRTSEQLKSLNEEIRDARRYYDSTETYNDYDEKSKAYYLAANNHLRSIKDSILRIRIDSVVKASSDRYASYTLQHKNLLGQLETNGIRIDDLYSAMKVLVTLPDIENYQKKNLPSPAPLQKAINKQKNVIRKMDSVVAKGGK